ncbi:MAG TPA: DM13 domain-containing protein [Terriglobia bacterium]|nr:DM13 domain-containing protein [Terriglobia bacterium]
MKKVWIGVGVVVVALAWYAFRPELLFVNKSVSETFPAAASANSGNAVTPKQLASGQFKGYAHETSGSAAIYEVDGKRVLRLTGFMTSNGPDVHVYLVAAPDAKDDDTVKNAGFVDLGSLKGNVGDQNYDVPVNVDLSKYQAVTIWCARFNVNFGTAPLATL